MEDRRYFLKKSAIIAAMTAFPALQSCIPLNTIKAKVPSKSKKIKTAVVIWYSQTGNTQKCGKVLAKTFEKNGIKVTYGDLREIDTSIVPGADLIVVGSPVFYYDTPDFVKDYIKSLPDITGIPVAAYVTFGGPEGNQQNAGCSILEGLVQKNGVPVGLKSFMCISSYSLSFKGNDTDAQKIQKSVLPDKKTYKKVSEYAGFIKSQVEKGKTSEFKKFLTLREFSTYFGPEWWTKLTVDNHYIIEEKCVGCGICVEKCPTNSIDLDNFSVNTDTCVLCFGCLNNCQYQAMNMENDNKKLISLRDYMIKNSLKLVLPNELKT
jgi:ferredoxin/flavodoxin